MDDRVLTSVYPINIPMIDSHPEQDRLGSLDAQAVTAVYNQYFPEIYHYVQYRLEDDALAEDITSEVFLSLLKALKCGSGPGTNLRGWLLGAARHMVVDHFRRKYRHPNQELSDEIEADESGPCHQVEQHESAHALHLAFIRLTEDQQQVLTLRFGQGYSLEETAALMKKKINAIKALQFRALNALQRKIGAESESVKNDEPEIA
jgi:RNA polymerase sigma-70 factor, ECF subfamily